MSQYQVEGARHLGEIQGLDQQRPEPALPVAFAAEEAAELILNLASSPCRLVLERPQRRELRLSFDHPLNRGGAQSADQLFLQVRLARVEPKPLHVGATQVGTETSPFECAFEITFLACVVETGQPHVEALRAVYVEEAPDVRRPSHRHDGNALRLEFPTASPSQRLERELVADPLNQNHRTRNQGKIRLCRPEVGIGQDHLIVSHAEKVPKAGYTAMSFRANLTAPMPRAMAATAITPTTDVTCHPCSRGVP